MKFRPILILLIWAWLSPAQATSLNFHIIAEKPLQNSSESIPLSHFFDYMTQATGIAFSGSSISDTSQALELFKNKRINFAIVSSDFFDQHKDEFSLSKIFLVIPNYASAPHERLYILASNKTDLQTLLDQPVEVNLFSSKLYDQSFLNEKLFIGNDQIKKIPWFPRQTEDIFAITEKVAGGTTNTFVLLSSEEFAAINKLKTKKKDLLNLKLIFASPSLPGKILVLSGNLGLAELEKIKTALLRMPSTLNGDVILNKIGLKGFATP